VSGAFARGREGAATTGAEDFGGNCCGGAALLGSSWVVAMVRQKQSLAVKVQKQSKMVYSVSYFSELNDSGRSFRSTFSFGYFDFFCNSNHMFCCLLIMEPGSTWGRMEKKMVRQKRKKRLHRREMFVGPGAISS
jgi:hypothetical protein